MLLSGQVVLHVAGALRWTSHLSHPFGCWGRNMVAAAEVSPAFGERAALWFRVSPSPARRMVLTAVSHRVTLCRTGPGRGTPVGDRGQPGAADALLR